MKSQKIKLIERKHRGENVVFMHMAPLHELHELARRVPGATWSNTFKTWYVPRRRGVVSEIRGIFEGVGSVRKAA
jgi:hypothetical protein